MNDKKPYRPLDNVAIQRYCTNGYAVGSFNAGEWISYTVSVAKSRPYILEVVLTVKGTENGSFHLEFDGKNKTGPIAITPGSNEHQTIKRTGINLKAGQHDMRIVMDTGNNADIAIHAIMFK